MRPENTLLYLTVFEFDASKAPKSMFARNYFFICETAL